MTLWRFSHSKHGATTVRIKPAMSTNDGTILRAWAMSGLGIIVRSEWDVADDLAAGRIGSDSTEVGLSGCGRRRVAQRTAWPQPESYGVSGDDA